MQPPRENGEHGTGAPQAPGLAEHWASMAVWDVRSPVEGGSRTSVKVGVRCDQGCNLGGSRVEVVDGEREISGGTLGDSPAPGTEALYWTVVELDAPRESGYHEWSARLAGRESQVVHRAPDFRFAQMVTESAEYRLTICVVDGATSKPLDGAYVRVGPKTLYCDMDGKVTAPVSKGGVELVAWKRDHRMFRTTVDVKGDSEIDVELTPFPCKYCPDST